MTEFHGLLIESVLRASSTPRAFDVVIIAAGNSKNSVQGKPLFYSEELLASAEVASLFEGAAVNAHRFGEEFDHLWDDAEDKSRYALNTVGVLEGVHYGEGALRGRLRLHEGAEFVAGLLKLSVERETPLVGLSIDAKGSIEFTTREGREVAQVTAFAPGPTVDIVSRPAAGGEIVRIAASLRKEQTMPEESKTPQGGDQTAAAVADPPKIDEEALEKRVRASVMAELDEKRKAEEKAKDEIRAKILESEKLLDVKLSESNLPDKAQKLLRKQFGGSTFKEEDLDEAIGLQRDVLKEADQSGRVNVPSRFAVDEPNREKVVRAELYDMFMQNSVEVTRHAARKSLKESGGRPVHSILKLVREAYGVDLRDLDNSSGRERMRLTESLTTSSWTDIFGDVMNKALLDAYHANPWTDWRKVVRVKPLKDFMTQHSIRMGGYSNLATVAEGANYPAMTSPGDEEHEWTPTKRGGTEDLTREMILADDVMAIGRIPTSMAYAAARTVYEFVFDQLTIAGQPTMDYDSTALFATSRTYNDNLGTTALAAAEIAVVWLAMQKFTDMSSNKREPVQPKYLLVPPDLAGTAMSIIKPLSEYAPGETQNAAFVRTFGLELIIVAHWTNAKDHVYVADPALVPGFLMGFVGGQEDPALFVQDNASFGSVFDRDAITYKVRHEYGGSPVDHRAFYAEDVA